MYQHFEFDVLILLSFSEWLSSAYPAASPPPRRAWVQPQQHLLSPADTAVSCFLCSESRIFCRELGSHKGHNSESEPL